MKVYNVTIDNKVVATSELESSAYRFYDDLILLMPSSNIKVIESFVEERSSPSFDSDECEEDL